MKEKEKEEVMIKNKFKLGQHGYYVGKYEISKCRITGIELQNDSRFTHNDNDKDIPRYTVVDLLNGSVITLSEKYFYPSKNDLFRLIGELK